MTVDELLTAIKESKAPGDAVVYVGGNAIADEVEYLTPSRYSPKGVLSITG